MKKFLALILIAIFIAVLFSGCKSKSTTTPTPSPSPATTTTPSPSATPATSPAGKVKTGIAVITSLSKSMDAGEADGLAQVDSSIVAVTVGADGKIAKCAIDGVQTKINFSATGKLITPANTVIQTKKELGDSYGMKSASGIGKEWYEQAAVLAKYVQGKTAAEVKGIAVDEERHATGSDLKASVTISIGGFIDAIDKAVSNAKDYGASSADKLSIGVVTNMNKSTSAGENDGLAEAYSTYVAVTTDAGGKITSCIIDASQGDVNFDTNGKIKTDLSAPVSTKNELGDAYGMKSASKIGKEWYEQAAAFAEYVTGKTATEVEGIAVDTENHATGTDLKASVTISIGDFKAALAKAAA